MAATVLTATLESGGGGGGGGVDTGPFPDKTTSTISTATFSLKIEVDGSAVSDGTVAAYIGDDIRSGAVSGSTGPGGFVFSVSGGLTETELTAQTFTFKYKNTSNHTYICSPTIDAGPGDNIGNAMAAIVLTATLESGGGGGGGGVDPPTKTGSFSNVEVEIGADATTSQNLTDVFSNADSYTYVVKKDSASTTDVTAATEGGNVKISATSGAAEGSYVVTVTATNAGGSVEATIAVTVVAGNQPPTVTTSIADIRVGTSTKGGDIKVPYKSVFSDDGSIDGYSVSSNNSNFTAVIDGDDIKITVAGDQASGATAKITITATDNDGAETSDNFNVTVEDTKLVYVYTENSGENGCILKVSLTAGASLAGLHLKYKEQTQVPSYVENDNQGEGGEGDFSEASTYENDWGTHKKTFINDTVETPYMVFFTSADKALATAADFDFAYFKNSQFAVDIVALSDQYGNLINTDDYTNLAPPLIFEDTEIDPVSGNKYGDVNVDGTVDSTDLDLLKKYLVGDNEVIGDVDGAITIIENKIAAVDRVGTYVAIEVEGANNKPFGWIDLNGNGAIDVGDLTRLAEFLAAPATYTMISNRNK